MIPIGMRWRLVPLIARKAHIAIDKDVFPRHEYVIENDIAVGLVEPTRQRIVEGIVSPERKRPTWNEFEARRVDGDSEAVGVVLVSWLQCVDATQMNPVRKNATSRDLLRASNNDTIVPLLDHACV